MIRNSLAHLDRMLVISIFALIFFLLYPPQSTFADMIGGNEIIARTTRDGVGGYTFVDMTHTVQFDGIVSGWNIWAQSYAASWPASTAPRSIKLIILRSSGSDLVVLGKSNLETVAEWDKAYHFDLATPITVKAGDLIGWYDAETVTAPGGVISFGLGAPGACLTRWASGVELSGSTPLSSLYTGEARIYSINVEGSPTSPSAPIGVMPIPGNNHVTLTWTSVSGATTYNLYYSTTPGVTRTTGSKITGVTSPYTLSPLTNGTTYYFVVTAVNNSGESTESDQVSTVPNTPSAYSISDLVGNWTANSLATLPGAPWWERASIATLPDGSFSGTAIDSSNTNYPVSGTFSITSDGIISRQGIEIPICVMDAGRTLFACTDTWGAYPDYDDVYTKEMKVFVKKGESYTQADLTGTWEMNQLGTPGPHWARGRNLIIAANGSFTGSLEGHDFASRAISGTAVMNAGKITVSIPSESSTAQCDMDLDKTVFVCTETRNSETMLSIFVRKAASYSQSDLPGLWNINNLISPMAWWGRVFPMTVLADLSFSGHLIGSESDTEDLSGTFNINGDGIVTSASVPFSFAMDAGKSIMCGVGTGSEGDSNLLIIAKQAQPTANTLSSLVVSSGPSSVNEGAGGTYGATAYWSDGTSSAVTPAWSVSPITDASINSSSGALTAFAVSGDQEVTVTATYSSGGRTLVADRKVTIIDLQDTLNVSITGAGAGSVYSVPSGPISCHYSPLSGACTTIQNHGSSIELTASPDGGDSVFSSWSGACTNSAGNCTVVLDEDKTVTAAFSPAPLAKIGTTPFDTIQAAYGAAALSGSTIMLKGGDPGTALGTLNANDNKSVTIQGGYNAQYDARSGSTTILGPVTLGLGSLVLDSVGIR